MPHVGNRLQGLLITLAITTTIFGGTPALPQGQAEGGVRPATARSPRRSFDRVFIIVLENADYGRALQQPFLRYLTTIGALLSDYHAITHPSYPNYLAMVAGTTFGIDRNDPKDLDATSLVDLLESAGVTWKVYAENLPAACFTGVKSRDGLYVRRHEPYISFRNIQTSPARCNQIENAAQLQADLAKDALPQYSLYVPNLRNSGHDTPWLDPRAWVKTLLGCNPRLANADAWLQRFLAPLLLDPHFTQGTLVVVTFDENNGARGNQIYTVVVGPMVQPGVSNGNRYDHYSLLRTIEDNLGIGTLGREDATATPICCIWKEGSR